MDTRTTAISSSSRRGRRRRNTRTTTTTSTSGHFHEDGTMSRQIPTVDLTMLPIPRSPPQIFLLPAPMVVQTNLEVQTTDTVTMPSQVYLVPTTEGTDGATVAAPMVTGHQVAPSDNLIN